MLFLVHLGDNASNVPDVSNAGPEPGANQRQNRETASLLNPSSTTIPSESREGQQHSVVPSTEKKKTDRNPRHRCESGGLPTQGPLCSLRDPYLAYGMPSRLTGPRSTCRPSPLFWRELNPTLHEICYRFAESVSIGSTLWAASGAWHLGDDRSPLAPTLVMIWGAVCLRFCGWLQSSLETGPEEDSELAAKN